MLKRQYCSPMTLHGIDSKRYYYHSSHRILSNFHSHYLLRVLKFQFCTSFQNLRHLQWRATNVFNIWWSHWHASIWLDKLNKSFVRHNILLMLLESMNISRSNINLAQVHISYGQTYIFNYGNSITIAITFFAKNLNIQHIALYPHN